MEKDVARELQVARQMGDLQAAIDGLDKTTVDLADRLKPVVSEKEEKLNEILSGTEVERALLCPLANALREKSSQIQRIVSYLRSLNNRLEV